MEVEEIEDDFFQPQTKPDPVPFKPQELNNSASAQPAATKSIFNEDNNNNNNNNNTSHAGGGVDYQPNGGGGGNFGGGAGGGYQPSGGGSSFQPGGRRRRNFLLGGVQARDGPPNSMLPADPPRQEEPAGYQPSSMQPSPEPQQQAQPSGSYSPSFSDNAPPPAAEEPPSYVPSMGRRAGGPSAGASSHTPATRPEPEPEPQPQPQLHQHPQPAAPPAQDPALAPSPAPAPSKPGGGFKFKFGKMSAPTSPTPERRPSPPPAAPSPEPAPPSSAHGYTPPESAEPAIRHKPAQIPVDPGPSGAGAHATRNASPGPGPAASAAAAVNLSRESVLSDLSRISSNKGGDRVVQKTDRLRALEEELAALSVDTKLDNAYLDDQGRDLKPKPKKKKVVESEDVQARVDTRLGTDADDNARHELLKAYQQVRRHQIENEKLKEQLDACMNAYDEIARLKNMVAEKVQVISVLEKERGALHKLHRQYQKEKLDQDAIESQYGERVRRVNEELRVAKAKVHKYKEIHGELEGTLAKSQDRVRQLEDKNKELRQKLTAITGNSKVPADPDKLKKKLAEKEEQVKKLEHEKEVLHKVAESAQRKLDAKDKQRLLGKQEAEENNAELRRQLEGKERQLRETQVLLERQQSRMRRLKMEHMKLKDLNKDRLKLEKILDEPLDGNEDSALFLAGIEPISRASSVNSMLSIGSRSGPRRPQEDIRHFNAEGDRVPEIASSAHARASGSRGDAKKRWKPESPAEMAAFYKNKDAAADGGGTGYLSLLSPQAKSALEEARTWRSTASKANSVSVSPTATHRSPGDPRAAFQGHGGGVAERSTSDDVRLEPHGGEKAEGAYGGGDVAGEEVADDEDYGDYNDDFEDVDLEEELSRRSSRASGRQQPSGGGGGGIQTFARKESSKSIGRDRTGGGGRGGLPARSESKKEVAASMMGEEVDEEELDEEVASPSGGGNVEEEDMDLLLAGLTNEQGPPEEGEEVVLPKLPLRQDSAVKSDAASSNPSTNRSKGSKPSRGRVVAKQRVEKQPSSKATPRTKFGARR